MPSRDATTHWEGGLQDGTGQVTPRLVQRGPVQRLVPHPRRGPERADQPRGAHRRRALLVPGDEPLRRARRRGPHRERDRRERRGHPVAGQGRRLRDQRDRDHAARRRRRPRRREVPASWPRPPRRPARSPRPSPAPRSPWTPRSGAETGLSGAASSVTPCPIPAHRRPSTGIVGPDGENRRLPWPTHQPAPRGSASSSPASPRATSPTRLHLDDPALQRRYRADLDRVRDAELRAEIDTEGVRLH